MRGPWTTLLAVALCLVFAGPATAATINLQPGIQGAGSIEYVADETDYPCPATSQDERVEVQCDLTTLTTDDPLFTVELRAVPAVDPTGHWDFLRWDDCPIPPTTTGVCVVPGAIDLDAAPVAVFDDTLAPTIGAVTESRSGDNGENVTFEFEADEDATFTCRVDELDEQDCSGVGATGAITYPDLPPGNHTFYVRGTDASGQTGTEDDTVFTIEPPSTTEPPGAGPPASPPAIVTPPHVFPKLLIPRVLGPSSVKARVSRKRVLSLGKVRLSCPAVVEPCRASAVLKGRTAKGRKPVVLARKSVAVRPSTGVAVKLRLGRKFMAALEAKGRLRATASLTVKAPNVTTRKDVAVTLRPAKR